MLKSPQRRNIDAELIRTLLDYDPTTGVFRWKPRTPDMFETELHTTEHMCKTWNSRYAGNIIDTKDRNGYTQIIIFKRKYRANRIAWLYITGCWPTDLIDHDNTNTSDDRFDNLRPASFSQNQANRRLSSNNRSGVKGVSWCSKRNKWRAVIQINRKQIHIGYFDTIDEAYTKVCEARYKYHGDFARVA